jgi:hypothetical protein
MQPIRLTLAVAALFYIGAVGACETTSPHDPDAGAASADSAPGSPDAAPPSPDAAPVPTCPASWLGSGDGCDCGCGVFDPDCPSPLSADACVTDNCGADYDLDPADPVRCIATQVPAGWTCSAYYYGDDGVCSCGCGAFDDKDCDLPLTPEQCSYSQNGCPSGQTPDPDDPTACETAPAGWTCHWSDYYDDRCNCGCGVADPQCPPSPHVSDCQYDGCPSGQSPDPGALTQCISNAPQDQWTCDLALLADGGQCDCGCGAEDPDCGTDATAAACDVVHCGTKEELKPGQTAACWELCVASPQPVGNATCTNGGSISIFNSCQRSLSACTDGRTYEVECSGGQCVCRVNGQCVGHATGGCSLNSTCGWSLIDAI